jgi:uncharacterized protein YcfJ
MSSLYSSGNKIVWSVITILAMTKNQKVNKMLQKSVLWGGIVGAIPGAVIGARLGSGQNETAGATGRVGIGAYIGMGSARSTLCVYEFTCRTISFPARRHQ